LVDRCQFALLGQLCPKYAQDLAFFSGNGVNQALKLD
jgi:hypothetical protein